MRTLLYIYATLIFLIGACTPDDLVPVTEPPIALTPKQICIVDTISDDSTAGYIVMDPIGQEFGRARGTVINQEFEAGLRLTYKSDDLPNFPDSIYQVSVNMIWPNRSDSLEGETISLKNIPVNTTQKCFPIHSTRQNQEPVRISHLRYYADVPYLRYSIDTTFDNNLYVDTFDVETGFFHGYFSVRMIGDTFFLPELPRVVEYINVEMTAP